MARQRLTATTSYTPPARTSPDKKYSPILFPMAAAARRLLPFTLRWSTLDQPWRVSCVCLSWHDEEPATVEDHCHPCCDAGRVMGHAVLRVCHPRAGDSTRTWLASRNYIWRVLMVLAGGGPGFDAGRNTARSLWRALNNGPRFGDVRRRIH